MSAIPPTDRRRIVVTGASSGIGAAVSKSLVEGGYDVAAISRRTQPLEALRIRGRAGRAEVKVIGCDLADRAATDAALEGLLEAWPTVDGVVINAGMCSQTGLEDPDTREFDRHLELNLSSPLRLLRRLVPAMNDGGRIVAIGSVLARFGVPGLHGYCASKAGLNGLVRSLALDLAPRGITVNAINPGWVDTDMARGNVEQQAPGMGMKPDAAREFFERQVPLGRFLEPEEIALQVIHLLGEGGAGMTGQAINVGGGVMA